MSVKHWNSGSEIKVELLLLNIRVTATRPQNQNTSTDLTVIVIRWQGTLSRHYLNSWLKLLTHETSAFRNNVINVLSKRIFRNCTSNLKHFKALSRTSFALKYFRRPWYLTLNSRLFKDFSSTTWTLCNTRQTHCQTVASPGFVARSGKMEGGTCPRAP